MRQSIVDLGQSNALSSSRLWSSERNSSLVWIIGRDLNQDAYGQTEVSKRIQCAPLSLSYDSLRQSLWLELVRRWCLNLWNGKGALAVETFLGQNVLKGLCWIRTARWASQVNWCNTNYQLSIINYQWCFVAYSIGWYWFEARAEMKASERGKGEKGKRGKRVKAKGKKQKGNWCGR